MVIRQEETRAQFHREIARPESEVVAAGGLVNEAIIRAVECLRDRDVDAARAIDLEDVLIDGKRYQIEEEALQLLATQQPTASDLRRLAAYIQIVIDLERMGDYAAGIARICVLIGDELLVKPLIDIPRMAEKSTSMLDRALKAFMACDVQ